MDSYCMLSTRGLGETRRNRVIATEVSSVLSSIRNGTNGPAAPQELRSSSADVGGKSIGARTARILMRTPRIETEKRPEVNAVSSTVVRNVGHLPPRLSVR